MEAGVHLKEIKEGKSEMMAGGATMNFVPEITYIKVVITRIQ